MNILPKIKKTKRKYVIWKYIVFLTYIPFIPLLISIACNCFLVFFIFEEKIGTFLTHLLYVKCKIMFTLKKIKRG
jgi:hypothetical protein